MQKRSAAACLSVLLAFPTGAKAMQVICPPLVREAMEDFAASYTRKTGIAVTVKADVMGKIMDDIKAGPADVILLPPGLMDRLATDGGLLAGTRQKAGRVEIGLAVRPGAAHPDISTVAKLARVLKSASAVAYTQPGPPRNSMEAGIIDGLMHRQEFSGVRLITVTTGSGVSAVGKGAAEMALQVIPEIASRKDVELVGPLPEELAAHIDVDIAVSKDGADAKSALDFVRTIMRRDAAAEWKKFGLDR